MEEYEMAAKKIIAFLNSVKQRQGPTPAYTQAHFFMCLYTIARLQPIGRKRLARELGLGEGSVRSMVYRLKELGVLNSSRTGLELSRRGMDLIDALYTLMTPPKPLFVGRIALHGKAAAVLVRGGAVVVGNRMRIRDEALRHGALGATTLTLDRGKLRIPGVSQDAISDFPETKGLLYELKPSEGDAIVVGTAEEKLKAEIGAIAGALLIIRCLVSRAHSA